MSESVPVKVSSAPQLKVHKQYPRGPSTDVAIESSDAVVFYLCSKNLEATTGAFPGAEFNASGETVQLSEKADVLELLFQFVLPKRHPTLKVVGLTLLTDLAEAANKYEVFSAMNICEIRLMAYTSIAPLEILAHGLKHDYPDLVEACSRRLARTPLSSTIEHIPIQFISQWVEYCNAWDGVFKQTVAQVRTTSLCHKCRASVIVWIMDLQEINSVSVLNTALSQVPKLKPSLCYTHQSPSKALSYSVGCRDSEAALLGIIRGLNDSIKAVPSFSHFMKGKRKRAD